MKKDAETHLLEALERCNQAKNKIEETMGYCSESKTLRLLGEVIKEQFPNEDSSHSVSDIR